MFDGLIGASLSNKLASGIHSWQSWFYLRSYDVCLVVAFTLSPPPHCIVTPFEFLFVF